MNDEVVIMQNQPTAIERHRVRIGNTIVQILDEAHRMQADEDTPKTEPGKK